MKTQRGEHDFEVTTNDASKTVFLDADGNPIPDKTAEEKPAEPAAEKQPKTAK